MKNLINRVKSDTSKHCLTISFNTNRTAPDRYKDEIVMKNLSNGAEQVLLKRTGDKRMTKRMMNKLHATIARIDFSKNLDSLIVFVSEKIGDFVTLPIPVEERISVCDSFIIRDVIRAGYSSQNYYVLILDMDEADLMKAFNNRPVGEFGGVFPLNAPRELQDPTRSSSKTLNKKEGFLNEVDKLLNEVIKGDDYPVVVCAQESTYSEFLKVADKRGRIIGRFTFSQRNIKNADLHIAETAWPIVQHHIEEETLSSLSVLEKAISANRCISDLTKIAYGSNKKGVLFVKQGYYQPARMIDGVVVPVKSDTERGAPGVIDDIISDFIQNTILAGGEVVFLSGNQLDAFSGIALVY